MRIYYYGIGGDSEYLRTMKCQCSVAVEDEGKYYHISVLTMQMCVSEISYALETRSEPSFFFDRQMIVANPTEKFNSMSDENLARAVIFEKEQDHIKFFRSYPLFDLDSDENIPKYDEISTKIQKNGIESILQVFLKYRNRFFKFQATKENHAVHENIRYIIRNKYDDEEELKEILGIIGKKFSFDPNSERMLFTLTEIFEYSLENRVIK